ncbi:MAG: guanylate-binding protein [Monoraphidium minutum]|nr:MAG: guanylate-binding protein [Monoraphidium minutum]
MQFFKGRASTPPAAKVPQGVPLLLIGFDEAAQTWRVNPEAAALLARVPGPLCTLAVCGRARQGKSFLLNTLLGRLTGQELPQGFKVSPTQHSCTRGLWMWSVPIPMKDADGRPCNLLLVDCEGVDAVDQGQKHSAQVFSLAVLLSSVFVYNQVGAIDAVALERLAMVCELAKRIKERSAPGGGRGGQADFHPAFVWLLRDFQLQLAAGGRGSVALSPGQYLEEVLADVRGGGGPDEANRNQMRSTIKAVFPDRDAATLLRPMLKEEDLHALDTIPYSKLRPEFQKGMDDLMGLLRSKAHPLAVSGQMVSGRVYAQLAGAYVEALNKGAVPTLVTAWQGIAAAECSKAYDAALAAFDAAFRTEGAADEAALFDTYQAALGPAVRGFKDAALGDAALLGEYEERLRKVAEERFTSARAKLKAVSEAAAEAMLNAEQAKLAAMMEGPAASLDAVEAELRRFLADYDAKVQGPWKYRRASEFLMNTCIVGIKGLVARILAERDAARRKAADAEAAVAKLRAEAARSSQAESRAAGAQRELAAARDTLARAEGQLAAKGSELADARAEVTRLAAQVSGAGSRERQLQSEVAAARAEAARLTSQLGGAQRAEAEAVQLRSQLAAAQAAASTARAEAERARVDVQAAERRVAQLQTSLAGAEAAGREAGELRSQLAEAARAADEARLTASRAAGEKDEERAVANRTLREVTELQAQLLRERERHDATKDQLKAAEARLAAAAAAGPHAETPATGRTAGRAAAPPTTGGRTAKRRREGTADDDAAQQQQQRRLSAAAAAVAATTPTSGGRPRQRQRRGTAEHVAEPMEGVEGAGRSRTPTPPPSGRGGRGGAVTPASPSTGGGGGGGTPVVVVGDLAGARAALPSNVDSMSIGAIKAWFTAHRLEDEEFMALAAGRGKKADWVALAKRRAGLA